MHCVATAATAQNKQFSTGSTNWLTSYKQLNFWAVNQCIGIIFFELTWYQVNSLEHKSNPKNPSTSYYLKQPRTQNL
jgi:hypothetical protein